MIISIKNSLLSLFALVPFSLLLAQSEQLLPLGDENHRLYDRLEIKLSDFRGEHSHLKSLYRNQVREMALSAYPDSLEWDKKTIRNKNYILADNNDADTTIHSKKAIWKYFYRSPAHLWEVRTPDFYLSVNPILHLDGGMAGGANGRNLVFLNRRGLQLRGQIAKRIYFYTDIIESQANYPDYVNRQIKANSAIPGMGYYKVYDSSLTPAPDDGFDFLTARGLVGFQAFKQLGFQLGHGKNFIGDGHRSLFLSDFSNDYFFFKINTKVWRIHYQNLFAELIQDYDRGADKVLPKKFLAAHHLSINILKNLNVSLFESVVFGRKNGIELQYFNPLIFYRTVEQGLGSPDNVVLGASVKYNFLNHFSVYGQLVLDEFVFSELFIKKRGWWANKYGVQLGAKYIDAFGIKDLDLQIEYNMVRPYTYTFRDSSANYTHYNQALAHPLGANFKEMIAIAHYQILPDLFVRGQFNWAMQGLDTLGANWGGNIHKGYGTFMQEFGNKTLQGVRSELFWIQFLVSYRLRHNMYVEASITHRQQKQTSIQWFEKTNILSLGFRWNIWAKAQDW